MLSSPSPVPALLALQIVHTHSKADKLWCVLCWVTGIEKTKRKLYFTLFSDHNGRLMVMHLEHNSASMIHALYQSLLRRQVY